MSHSFKFKGDSEKKLLINGIQVIGINNVADIAMAIYKYLFFSCFLEKTETMLECWFNEWTICDKQRTKNVIVIACL